MKKGIVIVLTTMVLLCGCGQENEKNKDKQFTAKIGEIQDLKASSKEMPDFTIVIKGLEDDTITKEDIKDIKMYDFVVDVTAYDIDPETEVYREKWTGIKFNDVLSKKGITTYDAIDFKSTGNITVTYEKEEINDKLYLVFYRNDVLLSDSEDTPVMLFATNLKNRYWVPSLTRIDVK